MQRGGVEHTTPLDMGRPSNPPADFRLAAGFVDGRLPKPKLGLPNPEQLILQIADGEHHGMQQWWNGRLDRQEAFRTALRQGHRTFEWTHEYGDNKETVYRVDLEAMTQTNPDAGVRLSARGVRHSAALRHCAVLDKHRVVLAYRGDFLLARMTIIDDHGRARPDPPVLGRLGGGPSSSRQKAAVGANASAPSSTPPPWTWGGHVTPNRIGSQPGSQEFAEGLAGAAAVTGIATW